MMLAPALLLAAALAAVPSGGAPASAAPKIANAEQAIRDQRAAFNRAIAIGDIRGIAAVLADNVQMVTGTDSSLYSGKAAQLEIWSQNLRDRSRGIYVRTPDRRRPDRR